MKNPLAVICLLFSALCPLLRAGVVDLAPDLGYLRVRSVVLEREAITQAMHQPPALVLDLRYTLDERDAGEVLRQELATQAAKPRLYVLVSPATPLPVVGVVAAQPVRWLVTLGIKGARPEPQVVVQQSAANDRQAYDALASGTALADLISGRIEKERFDEASLVQEFNLGHPDPQPPPVAPTEGTETKTPDRLTDRVLQRAVHLHRALAALKR